MPPNWKGPGNVVRWGGHAIRDAVRKEHYEVARWLLDNTPHETDEEEMNEIIQAAAGRGNLELARSLMPLDAAIVNYVNTWAKLEVIEHVMETTDGLKKNQDFAAEVVWKATRQGDLNLVQRLAKLHERGKKKEDWLERWEWGIGNACTRGDLPMTKWMIEHPTGRGVCVDIQRGRRYSEYFDDAAAGGHIEVLQYLLTQGFTDSRAGALSNAARGGHLDTVKWLLINSSTYDDINCTDRVVVEVAKNGHLDILMFFHDLASNKRVTGNKSSKRQRTEQTIDWWE